MASTRTEPATHVVVMGVAGSGKTTLAQMLAEELGWPYAEADEFHPRANIDKMRNGTPLTDEDRWPWLREIRDWMSRNQAGGTIVTCSALKHSYRDLLREADGDVVFLHVSGTPELLSERISQRSGHFMPPSLLPSQLSTLEPLTDDEPGAVLVNDKTPDALLDAALQVLRGVNA
ncbi:gluconokinase [Zhihengliuella halotolerans]|uniref:Gluconokinase n=1 Tax=Zhihengliuella halotolerans TaxID=370736 RepID=A0A4Q8AHD5_9MICC|nr:gluconokinase [Zhihengliuella halotolerans]RZU63195.1 gluconokinase [Zhihengliuella halotolerans]